MVDAEAGVPLPAAGGIVPEGVELVVVGVEGPQGFGPALVEDPPPLRAGFRLDQRIVRGRTDREDVAVFGDDVPVAGKDRRPLVLQQGRGMLFQPLAST